MNFIGGFFAGVFLPLGLILLLLFVAKALGFTMITAATNAGTMIFMIGIDTIRRS